MTLLYGDLTTGDATQIAAELDITGIPYTLSEDGTQVSVESDSVGRARMLLAEEGLPSSGSLGYEIFDRQQGFGTTSFVQNINQLRALEGELARTVGTLGPIRTARVHLVMPERELFSRESQPATASVFISTRNRAAVGNEQILAIQHMIAAAVPQLDPSRVAIVDENGNLLARAGDPANDGTLTASTTEEMRMKYEQRLGRQIEDMVARVVGYGNVRAIVSADLDFSSVTRNSEIYDPEGQVVRSTQTISQDEFENSEQNNDVSVQNNLPGLPSEAAPGGNPQFGSNREEEVVNYEITRTIENFVQESGEIDKLSVAVLVDGRYEPAAGGAEGADAEAEDAQESAGQMVYVPRSEAELAQISSLVRSAIGYNESRGDTLEVVNMQFAREPVGDLPADETIMGLPRDQIVGIAETLIFSLVGVLALLLVVRPLISNIAASASAQNEKTAQDKDALMLTGGNPDQPQLAAPDGATGTELDATLDMSNVEGQVKESSVKKIAELVDSHPNETVSVIRNWMTQEN